MTEMAVQLVASTPDGQHTWTVDMRIPVAAFRTAPAEELWYRYVHPALSVLRQHVQQETKEA
jgi:hypothetical protein